MPAGQVAPCTCSDRPESRPSNIFEIKWGHRVSTNDHWMVKPTQRLLNAFNVQWIMTAREAETQLALMNGAGIIDAVMTDDSDSFVFGAQTVLRNSTFSIDSTVKLYTTSAIQEHSGARFFIISPRTHHLLHIPSMQRHTIKFALSTTISLPSCFYR
ncbi:uncharacterized protein F5147DRAFT_709672 [Suillus discolor]|uniref:XPG-I domain-containing protein n=1 Tax=Suillus discolor TaxID=1912936 RepID=A0A9P7F0F5_9AGAM|nr:uncharacterized protein F5147DRAFT_709672 [Suillus discolor]KAG2101068.1 hypothetical protein F5147DRAFT_709672 [Suillus discolor]